MIGLTFGLNAPFEEFSTSFAKLAAGAALAAYVGIRTGDLSESMAGFVTSTIGQFAAREILHLGQTIYQRIARSSQSGLVESKGLFANTASGKYTPVADEDAVTETILRGRSGRDQILVRGTPEQISSFRNAYGRLWQTREFRDLMQEALRMNEVIMFELTQGWNSRFFEPSLVPGGKLGIIQLGVQSYKMFYETFPGQGYRGQDLNWRRLSLERVIYHEVYHAAKHVGEYSVAQASLEIETHKKSNEFMRQHFQEPPWIGGRDGKYDYTLKPD